MAGKLYVAGRGPIVEDPMGQKFRLGVDDDGNITAMRAYPLLDDDYFPRSALPSFIQQDNSQVALHPPFATPPETPDPTGTIPAGHYTGTARVGQPNGRPPLLGPDGNTFWSNEAGQVGSDGNPFDGQLGGYYYTLSAGGWFRIHAKTTSPIFLDSQLSYTDQYPTYNQSDAIAVFDAGTTRNGLLTPPGYYDQPFRRAQFSNYRPGYGGYTASLSFVPTVGHYYFVAVGSVYQLYYSNYGYAVRANHMNLRWSGINQ